MALGSSIELAAQGTNTAEVTTSTNHTRQPTSTRIDQGADPESPTEGTNEFSLPPVDGGKDAWLFLAACFVLEGTVWGFPSVYGVFQDYYSIHEPFAGSTSIPVVGTCAMGLMYLGLPVAFGILKTFPELRRWSNVGGLLVMCLSLSMASFATNIPQLIATQGIIFAIGGVFAFTPCYFYIGEWFVKRLPLAYSVTFAGLGMAGAILPLVLQWLLSSYGHKTTLRISALIIFLLTAPFMVWFKPRVPHSQVTHSRRIDLSFWTSTSFLISQLGNMLVALGYFLPPIFLPTYARSIGAGGFTSTLTIILLNLAGCVGNIGMGLVMGKLHFSTCMLISTVGTIISVFLFWGLAESLPLLYVFSISYGLFASSFPSTWSGIVRDEHEKQRGTDMGMIFTTLAAGKGIGNVASGPLSEALLNSGPWNSSKFGYGSMYGVLIVFTGATAFCGACSFVARRVGWL
ncbi:MAG: hypothetical protein M1820_007869 [Bogoriella megaspora]|nr:MAG: hypothetical protein M1820_007869 [Bogoriella megaspora]